jgi:glyoxylase-like metal-dependent hydrolase (beta-lactamase superfamily II)
MRGYSMRLWSIEGNRQRLDGGAMFGNAPRALWSRWLTPDEENRVELACRGLLARDVNGKTVLFETGIGAFFEPKLKSRYGVFEDRHVLLDSLASCGVGHEDIDAVVLSHLHFDHAGGLLAAYREGVGLKLLFPNARFIISRPAWDRACHPHLRDHASFIPGLTDLLLESRRLEIVEGAHSPSLGKSVRFHFSDGHTPGLMLAEIGGSSGVVFCADLIPGRPWVHLPVTMGYDRFPEQLINEKQSFLEDKIARSVSLFFTHDRNCALALPVRDSDGRYGVTAEQPIVKDLELPL